jgi:hypothetical protein
MATEMRRKVDVGRETPTARHHHQALLGVRIEQAKSPPVISNLIA